MSSCCGACGGQNTDSEKKAQGENKEKGKDKDKQ